MNAFSSRELEAFMGESVLSKAERYLSREY